MAEWRRYTPEEKAVAAVIMYALYGEDLDMASAGTFMASNAFRAAAAVVKAGYHK